MKLKTFCACKPPPYLTNTNQLANYDKKTKKKEKGGVALATKKVERENKHKKRKKKGSSTFHFIL